MNEFIKTAVIGHPVSHSKSPLIHNYWIKKYGLHGAYEAIDIALQDLSAQFCELLAAGYRGFNVTIPHKETVMDLCDHVDETAKAIGAVNTIFISDGKIYGTNTDAYGALENMRQNAPEFDFSTAPAVVLGAGGAARAVVFGLLEAGTAEIRLLNRTREKAEYLAVQSVAPQRITVIDWEARNDALKNAGLLVNTTSLGMVNAPVLDIDLKGLAQGSLVNDIVYTPLYTPLLQQAQERGYQAITGIGMLLHQARPGFEKWYGVAPQIDKTLTEMVL